jgi:hypothetical protein
MPESTKIEIHNISLQTLLVDMETKGIPRIPRFQRDYVWERSKVAVLFDSIYQEFPIGSFFFWITPREYRDLYKDIPELRLPKPADYEQIKMILARIIHEGTESGSLGGVCALRMVVAA